MTAFVVAMAGIIFPKISDNTGRLQNRKVLNDITSHRLDIETGLVGNVEDCGSNVGASDDKVESRVIIFVPDQVVSFRPFGQGILQQLHA